MPFSGICPGFVAMRRNQIIKQGKRIRILFLLAKISANVDKGEQGLGKNGFRDSRGNDLV